MMTVVVFRSRRIKKKRKKKRKMYIIASYPGHMGGERRPGIDCLHMHNHSLRNLGIRLRLKIVSKINAYTSDILPNSEDNTSCDLKVGGDILGWGDINIMEIK